MPILNEIDLILKKSCEIAENQYDAGQCSGIFDRKYIAPYLL